MLPLRRANPTLLIIIIRNYYKGGGAVIVVDNFAKCYTKYKDAFA